MQSIFISVFEEPFLLSPPGGDPQAQAGSSQTLLFHPGRSQGLPRPTTSALGNCHHHPKLSSVSPLPEGLWKLVSLCPPVGLHLTGLQSLHLPSFKTDESLDWATEGFPSGSAVKNQLAMQETQEMGFDPWARKIPWRKEWQTHSSVLDWRIP